MTSPILAPAVKRLIQDGETKGIAEGKAKEKREMAKKLLADGFDAAFIAKYTGLTRDDILRLQ